MKKLIYSLIIISTLSACTFFKSNSQTIPKLGSQIAEGTIKHAGMDRTFLYYIPQSLPESPPLVIVLHKAKSDGADLRDMIKYRFDELADEKKFIVIYPNGFEGNWNDCRKSATDSAHKLDIDDVGFISSLIDYFKDTYSIDQSRVFVAGMSNGGHMCVRLASTIPEKITAIAPLLTQLPTTENSVCQEIQKAMPVLLLNGTNDPISPYEGGEISLLFGITKWGKVISVHETVNKWLQVNTITESPEITQFQEKLNQPDMWVEKKSWTKNGKPVVLQYIAHGAGHTLPGARHLSFFIFGKTYDNLSITDEIVSFFYEHNL